jgi:hypothetical protein
VTGPFRTDPPAGAAAGSGDPAPLDPDTPGGAGGPADGPGLKISAAKRVTMSTLLRRGIVVNVSIKQPGRVTLALRTADLDSDTRPSGVEEPKTVTLATAERTYRRAGRYKVVLKPRGRIRNRLKGHGTLTARYTVQARAPSGFIQVSNRRVRVAGSRTRKR